jgi:hypothetical protein
MAIFNKHPDDDDLCLVECAPGVDGLPDGVEPPPIPPLPGVGLHDNIERNVRSGIPGSGYPSRPLPEEEAATHLFNAHMRELTLWVARARAIIPAVTDAAAERCNVVDGDRARTSSKIEETEADVEAQREQLVDRELRFPSLLARVNNLLIAFAVAIGFVEVLGLQPVIGQVVGMPPEAAFFSAVGVVGLSVLAAWESGGRLHKFVTYEGPSRVRVIHGWWVVLLSASELALLIGIIYMRSQMRGQNLTSPVAGTVIYVGVQALAIVTAAGHGWRLNNPRVQELAHTERQLAHLQGDRAAIEDELAQARVWAESINEFHVCAWLSHYRAQIAEDFSRDVLDYRTALGQAHLEAGNNDAYAVLLVLPLPKFVPPAEADPDDPNVWINGFVLAL